MVEAKRFEDLFEDLFLCKKSTLNLRIEVIVKSLVHKVYALHCAWVY